MAQDRPLTFGVDRAALVTGLSTRFIRHLVAKAAARAEAGLPVPDDEIPHIRWSERIIRFREDDLRAWMRRRERGKGAEPETKEIA
jgi:hypothetical protein